MYEDLTLQSYLDTILSKEQQHILAYCLKNDVKVCLYGTGLGKSLTARLFRDAGYTNVFAPEGCTDVSNGALSVPNETGAVALCVKKEPSDIKLIEKPFTANDVEQWLGYGDDAEAPKDYLKLTDVKNGRYPRIRYLNPIARFPERARIEQTVVVDMTVGTGKLDDGNRQVKRYYTQKGTLIGELDRGQE